MKQRLLFGMVLVLALGLLWGCSSGRTGEIRSTGISQMEEPLRENTQTMATEETADREHSELYLSGVSPEDVVLYFEEVCLNAEIINYGDPTKLQKWVEPIKYICLGAYTEEDKDTLQTLVAWLNTVEGFPGMQETREEDSANLRIHFCGREDYLALMGEGFSGTDGGVTFWYNGGNEIYDGVIGYRTDVDQQIRNSVILEEIYNGLGPIYDTQLRRDSVIYSEFSTPQALSALDELILKLLYHPQMECGMDKAACEAVIRQLYY